MALSITRLVSRKNIFSRKFVLSDLIGNSLSAQSNLVRPLASQGFDASDFRQQPSFSNVSQQTQPSVILNCSPSSRQFLSLTNSNRTNYILLKFYSTDSTSTKNEANSLSKKEKLKKAVKEYGTTVIVFHVAISLLSLGGCYLAVISGLNLNWTPFESLAGSSEVAADVGLFVVAYAVHKAFAPIRISITLAATPFIVRYLRKINVLKPTKP